MSTVGTPTEKGLTEIVAQCEACGQQFVAIFHDVPLPCFRCKGKVQFVGRFAQDRGESADIGAKEGGASAGRRSRV